MRTAAELERNPQVDEPRAGLACRQPGHREAYRVPHLRTAKASQQPGRLAGDQTHSPIGGIDRRVARQRRAPWQAHDAVPRCRRRATSRAGRGGGRVDDGLDPDQLLATASIGGDIAWAFVLRGRLPAQATSLVPDARSFFTTSRPSALCRP